MANFKLTSNADYIVGTSGNDVIEEVISGNLNIDDSIDGGNGLDVIVVDEPSEDFLDAVMALEFLGIDSNSAIATIYPDIKNIEKIQFTDLIYTLADGKIEPISSTKPTTPTTVDAFELAAITPPSDMVFDWDFSLTENADTLDISTLPNAKNIRIMALGGNDTIQGVGGTARWIDLGDGNDSILGGDNIADTILGGAGDDFLSAGSSYYRKEFGAYFYSYNDFVKNVLLGGFGNDTLVGGITDDVLIGGAGDDQITGAAMRAESFDKRSVGNGSGNDTLIGGAGNDILMGGDGNNFLDGGAGRDFVYAGYVGNDTLIGGTEVDNLAGMGGVDTFIFAEGDSDFGTGNRDIIEDFDVTVAGEVMDFSAIANGKLTYAGTKAFSAINQVRYEMDFVNSVTIVKLNLDNDISTTEMEIELTGLKNLTADDFVLKNSNSTNDDVIIQPTSTQYPHTGTISISGKTNAGETLSIQNTLKDENGLGSFSYQWLQNGKAISGATKSTYTLSADDIGTAISVKVSYTDGLGKLETVTSDAMDLIESIPEEILEPTYALTVTKSTANEGETVTFKLTTENVEEGTEIPFTFSGSISDADVLGGFKTNSFVVDSKGNASLPVKFLADKFTEGQTENLTLTLDSGESQNVTVKDTSLTPKPKPTPNPTPSTKETILETRNPYFVGKNSDADNVRGSVISDDIQGNIGNDTLKGGEGDDTIDGGNDNDQLFGEDGDDKLKGGAGNDSINGGAGDDLLDGGEGNDTLDGGADTDKMIGGAGNDIYYVDNQKDVIEEATNSQGGNDTAFISIGLKWQNNFSRFIGVENFTLTGDKQDEFDAAGDDNANILTGNIGNNRLYGNGGNDTLIGNEGNDTLEGGAGIDLLKGGAGDDTYLINNEEDTIEDTQGVDTIQSSETITLSKYTTVESLKLTGNKPIKGTGNTNDNLIDGNDASNILFGKEGDDTLQGHGGDDTLIGDAGDNSLDGGDGEDTVRYSQVKDDYAIKLIDGRYSVIHKSTGETDELVDVEFVEFSDSTEELGVSHSALQLSISDVRIQEGNKAGTVNAKLVLTLDNPATETFTVDLNTEDGTATAGKDYRAVQKSVTFNEGEKSATLQIPIVSDKVFEADENFTVQMSNLSSDTVEFNNTSATVTILNDDKPTLSFKAVTIAEGQKGKANTEIIATLSETISQPVKVHYQTIDGTALSGKDFDATVSDLIIPANTKNATVLIPIFDDKISEATEKFTVKFSQPENALLPSDATAVVTITDNDSAIAIIGTAS